MGTGIGNVKLFAVLLIRPQDIRAVERLRSPAGEVAVGLGGEPRKNGWRPARQSPTLPPNSPGIGRGDARAPPA